ncbi:MAG: GNAT family N-acetyltransferase [Terracoccus sp.]
MSRPSLVTQRIELRPMTSAHLPLLVSLDADAEVMRFILGRARTRAEVHRFWGPICADLQADAVGLGWWVGFARGGQAPSTRSPDDATDLADFFGWWDLSPALPLADPDLAPERAELGYRLARAHWGAGLATEGARALVAHGFDTVGLHTVWAETMAVNAGSRGVMRRLGLHHVRTELREWDHPLPGAELGEVVYEITREEWLQGRDT